MNNIHTLIRHAINQVTPEQVIYYKKYLGMTSAGGKKTAQYEDAIETWGRVNPITSDDIQFINNYNQSSRYFRFWVNGIIDGLSRTDGTGGDIIIWDNKEYYVTSVPEHWDKISGWVSFIGVQRL